MADCSDCQYYRQASDSTSPVHILHWLTDSSHREVYDELKRITAEEYERKQVEEEEVKLNCDRATQILNQYEFDYFQGSVGKERQTEFEADVKPRLPLRFIREPLTVTHCVVHAPRSYYIPELKNWGATCKDHKPRQQSPDCQRCHFYTPSDTETNDLSEASGLVTAIGSNDPGAASILQSRIATIEGGIGPAKAHDLSLAYNSKGRLKRRLRYLPFCEAPCPKCGPPATLGKTSCGACGGTAKQLAQPEIFNRFLSCTAYRPSRTQNPPRLGSDSGPSTGQAGSIQSTSIQSDHKTTTLAALGISPFSHPPQAPGPNAGSVVNALAFSAIESLFDRMREAAGTRQHLRADPDEIPPDTLKIIVAGRPPLTNEMLRRAVVVASEASGAKFSPTQQRDYSALVKSIWQRNTATEITLQLELIRLFDADRSDPRWRADASRLLGSISKLLNQSQRKKLSSVVLESHPISKPQLITKFADTQQRLNLNATAYLIRAHLERNSDGSIDAIVDKNAVIRTQSPTQKGWKAYTAGERIMIAPNIILFDEKGVSSIRVRAVEV